MSLCKKCKRPLNESQWKVKDNITYKSCPKCSTDNGKEHVYYEFPENFGTTEKRITLNNPEGAQSYCYSCRSNSNNTGNKKLCSEL